VLREKKLLIDYTWSPCENMLLENTFVYRKK